ncbi:carbohydrate kinase [Arcanobacterium hippocoleae]|uniref:Fructokinase n=1 Tax=Arcanobacterium hippocoleae TaxID=149017 RepID=A0ABU1T3K6_9ACTO|nr:carbohydrate kinase [Arcanobacterium hippocoleae]MDR6939898.1 fructokinase [Arcanobacterium hippocoleae]
MSLLVIGESLIDVIYDADNAVRARQPGGSPLNVAIGLSRLGREVMLLTHIGKDADGQAIQDYCEREGVELQPGSVTATPTSLAHAHLSQDLSGIYSFEIHPNYPHPPTDPHERAALLESAPKLVHFGSVGAHLAPGNQAIKEWLDLYHGTSTISYDPNIRLDLVGPATRVREEITNFLPYIDIFKASEEDLAAVFTNETPAQIAQHCLKAGVKLFVVTYGSNGLELFTTQHQVRMPAIKAEIVDTVGAGDSLMAALIDGLAKMSVLGAENSNGLANISRGMLVSLGKFAATAASITVQRRGANPPTRKEVAAQSDLYSVGAL